MKIATKDLTRHALNWAVAMAEGDNVFRPRVGRPDDWDKASYLADGSDDRWVVRVQHPMAFEFVDWTYNPSGSWLHGGPILDRSRIIYDYYDTHPCDANDQVRARLSRAKLKPDRTAAWYAPMRGPTILIAGLRCYVASELGDEVDIPEELTR